jgi:hypothetical protein
MRRLLVLAALALVPPAACAQGYGINLAWNACLSEGGVTTRTSTCASNSGTNLLVGSFAPAAETQTFVGIEAQLVIHSSVPVMPDWWQFPVGPGCRSTAMVPSVAFAALPGQGCSDPFNGQAIALADYTTPFQGRPDAARIRVVAAMPEPASVSPGLEYYAFTLAISNARTTGANACAGCDIATCIRLVSIKLVTNDYTDQNLNIPVESTFASFQCGTEVIADPGGIEGCMADPSCLTAAQARSWGQIKSLYR